MYIQTFVFFSSRLQKNILGFLATSYDINSIVSCLKSGLCYRVLSKSNARLCHEYHVGGYCYNVFYFFFKILTHNQYSLGDM